MSTETIRLIRDGEMGSGGGEVTDMEVSSSGAATVYTSVVLSGSGASKQTWYLTSTWR